MMRNTEQLQKSNLISNPLTKGEIRMLSKRIENISNTIAITDENDIINNLERELDIILGILERSYYGIKKNKAKLRVVA